MRKPSHLSRSFFLLATVALSPLFAQGTAGNQNDPFGREAGFVNFLIDQGLFKYANLAIEGMRKDYPSDGDRLEVLEVGTSLRQGKTEQVEEILSKKNLAGDAKAD